MGRKIKDHTGERYGRLTVVCATEERKTSGNNAIWLCRCDCGKYVKVPSSELRDGARTKSCGCLRRSSESKNKTHGGTHERLYTVWMGMRRRCYDKSLKDYCRYGGRGISVCEEWKDYSSFRKWALENGYNEKAKYSECTLDRIDVNGNYSPDNCRFVSMIAQNNNKRNNKILEYRGEEKTISEWERETNSKSGFIRDRVNRGWSAEKALNTPPKYNSDNISFVGVGK